MCYVTGTPEKLFVERSGRVLSPWVIFGQFFVGLMTLAYLGWPYLEYWFGREVDVENFKKESKSTSRPFEQVLSDLEYDFRTGKLSEDDYERLRSTIFEESDLNVDPVPDSSESDDESAEDEIEQAVKDARRKLH